jgi:hypothetical protein
MGRAIRVDRKLLPGPSCASVFVVVVVGPLMWLANGLARPQDLYPTA